MLHLFFGGIIVPNNTFYIIFLIIYNTFYNE